MAFDDLKAELALLINQMENQPEDPHELYLQIREKLNDRGVTHCGRGVKRRVAGLVDRIHVNSRVQRRFHGFRGQAGIFDLCSIAHANPSA